MRTIFFTLLVVQISVMLLVSCTKKESIKSEEPIVPSVALSPAPSPAIPAQAQQLSPTTLDLQTLELPDIDLLEELIK